MLLGAAAAGAGATTMIVFLAALELGGTLRLMAAIEHLDSARPGSERSGSVSKVRPGTSGVRSWRRVVALAGIETVGLLYLRADLLLVGHLLGAGPGATYGLLYRVVDGAGGAAGTASLWLFAEAAARRGNGDEPGSIRVRSLRVFPAVACAAAAAAVIGAGALGSLVPRFASEIGTLRLLIAAVPLLVWNSLELHFRAARGRHAGVLTIGVVALITNVLLCVALVGDHGLRGAAIALLGAELVQTIALVASARPGERRILTHGGLLACAGCALLVAIASAVGGV